MNTRLARVRRLLDDSQLDGMLLTNRSNRFWLSGFDAEDNPPIVSAVLLIDDRHGILLTGATNTEWAASEALEFAVEAWSRPWEPFVAERMTSLGWRRIGIEDQALSLSSFRALNEAGQGQFELTPLADAIDLMRGVKDDDELLKMEAVIRLTDVVFSDATREIEPGTTERALAWRIERAMRECGADGPAFSTIVAAGPHAARPHHSPTDRPIETGEPIIIDMGARIGGYNGDLTRTIWLGEPSTMLVERYELVAQANAAARAAIRDGVAGQAIDEAGRHVIERGGFGEQFVHGIGHGLGVRVHEAPSAGPTSTDVVRTGNVMTVEPGIYLSGWGGIRIEDVGIVTADGFRLLTRAPKLTGSGGLAR